MRDEATDAVPPGNESTGLDHSAVERILASAGIMDLHLRVVDETGSTNADLAEGVRTGDTVEGSVVAAGTQTAGRGRLGRTWLSPPGGSLAWSIAIGVPDAHASSVSLVGGVAVRRALAGLAGGDLNPTLKWPNDVEIGGRKVSGLLSERVGGFVILGCGVNVGLRGEDLNVPNPTSLADEGVAVERETVLAACLIEVGRWVARWRAAGHDLATSGVLDAYRADCSTIGQNVRVDLPGDSRLVGHVKNVDASGRLVVVSDDGVHHVSVGDVTHLRPA